MLGVGGSTLQYLGEAHRLHPDSFALRKRTGQGQDGPLDYAALEPFHAGAEALIGVAGPADPGARWRSAPYGFGPHPFSPAAERLGQAARALGWDWSANPRAALPEARGATGRGATNAASAAGVVRWVTRDRRM